MLQTIMYFYHNNLVQYISWLITRENISLCAPHLPLRSRESHDVIADQIETVVDGVVTDAIAGPEQGLENHDWKMLSVLSVLDEKLQLQMVKFYVYFILVQ